MSPAPLCSFVDNVFKPSDEVLERAKEWCVVEFGGHDVFVIYMCACARACMCEWV